MNAYNCSNSPMIHLYNHFIDDIFVRFSVIMKNVLILFIKEYGGPIWRPPYDVIDDVITMKNTFSCIIWGALLSEVKLKLC